MAWQSIDTAPQDGSRFRAKGWNFGIQGNGSHLVWAVWDVDRAQWRNAEDPDEQLCYLHSWRTPPAGDRGQG